MLWRFEPQVDEVEAGCRGCPPGSAQDLVVAPVCGPATQPTALAEDDGCACVPPLEIGRGRPPERSVAVGPFDRRVGLDVHALTARAHVHAHESRSAVQERVRWHMDLDAPGMASGVPGGPWKLDVRVRVDDSENAAERL